MRLSKNVLRVLLITIAVSIILVGLSFVTVASLTPEIKAVESKGISDFKTYTVVIDEPRIELQYIITKVFDLEFGFDGMSVDELRLRQGDNVKFEIDSDINCDFVINGYGIEDRLTPGSSTEIMFSAKRPGVFVYSCGLAGNGLMYVR